MPPFNCTFFNLIFLINHDHRILSLQLPIPISYLKIQVLSLFQALHSTWSSEELSLKGFRAGFEQEHVITGFGTCTVAYLTAENA